ncbi:hypothetical protein FHR49_003528 [Xanthomonas campestris]
MLHKHVDNRAQPLHSKGCRLAGQKMINTVSRHGKLQLAAFGHETLALPMQMAAIGQLIPRRGVRFGCGCVLVAELDDDVRLAICTNRGKLPERHRHLRKSRGLQCGSSARTTSACWHAEHA